MTRLTREWTEGGSRYCSIVACEENCQITADEAGSCHCPPIIAVRRRLADYENTGLTPEEIFKLASTARSISPARLYARCFGMFELFCDGKPVAFKRRKTKEMVAYLIDRKGACCTAEEISACLWEDAVDSCKLKHNVRNLISDLKNTMVDLGLGEVLVRGRNRVGLKMDDIDSDYFRFLNGTIAPHEVFRGEYMEQYSWAEGTKGALVFGGRKL